MDNNKKTLASIIYEQEEKDVEQAINTLNKIADKREKCDSKKNSNATKTVDQKAVILDYLEKAYSGAKMMDDVEMMCRLSRAILAFEYDDMEHMPTWEEMQEAHMLK